MPRQVAVTGLLSRRCLVVTVESSSAVPMSVRCPCLAAEVLINKSIQPMNVCRFSFKVYFNQFVIPLTIKPSRNPSSNQPVL